MKLKDNPIYTSTLIVMGVIVVSIISLAVFQPDFVMSRQGLELQKKVNWAKVLSISVVMGSLGGIVSLIMRMEPSKDDKKIEQNESSSDLDELPRMTGVY